MRREPYQRPNRAPRPPRELTPEEVEEQKAKMAAYSKAEAARRAAHPFNRELAEALKEADRVNAEADPYFD